MKPIKEGLEKIINSKSKTFLAFCFCFLVGAGVASAWPYTPPLAPPLIGEGTVNATGFWPPPPFRGRIEVGVYGYALLFVFLFFAIIFWNKKTVRFFVFCSLLIVFGVWRFALTIPDCHDPGQLCFYNGRTITFDGSVSEEPDRRIGEARYTVGAQYLVPSPTAAKSLGAENIQPLPVSGAVLLKTRLYPEYHYGDRLQITCAIDKPEVKDAGNFRYDKYLARYGVWSVCKRAKSVGVVAGETPPPPSPLWRGGNDTSPPSQRRGQGEVSLGRTLMSQIFSFKSLIQNQISRLWPEPEGSLMEGLLYGSKSGLPPEITDDFNKTGITHIIAVSGFNITIIATTLLTVLIFIGLWRQQAYWAVMGTLLLFVIFTGATASVVRAAIMGGLVLTAQQIGRLSKIFNVLVFTAAVMMLVNPYVLVWDAGFQLSFLATIGLVYVSPVLESFVRSRDWLQPIPTAIIGTLTQTLSAIIMTLPLILYQFGRLSIVAPLVNVLVLWTVPILMFLGFIAIVVSFLFYPLGQLVAWVAGIGLKYVILIVTWFGNKSWSAVQFQIPWWGMSFMYTVIIFVLWRRSGTKIPRPSPLP